MAEPVPQKNVAYTFRCPGLISQATFVAFQANPTLAAGDVKLMKDGGALANITTLPAAISSGKQLTVALSQTEMNCDELIIVFSDVAGAEWADLCITIRPEELIEPTAVPVWPTTKSKVLGWLLATTRNKRLTTATTDKVRNDADGADIATATLADDGTTFTRGEYS